MVEASPFEQRNPISAWNGTCCHQLAQEWPTKRKAELGAQVGETFTSVTLLFGKGRSNQRTKHCRFTPEADAVSNQRVDQKNIPLRPFPYARFCKVKRKPFSSKMTKPL